MTNVHRPYIPLGVRLKAALLALGFTMDEIDSGEIQLDHDPALGLRVWDKAAGDYDPPANDPRFLTFRLKKNHSLKTDGTKATSHGSDKHEIAKIARIKRKQAGTSRPKQTIQSRGFPKAPDGHRHFQRKPS